MACFLLLSPGTSSMVLAAIHESWVPIQSIHSAAENPKALHSNGSGPNGPRLTYRPGAVFCGWSPPVCWSLRTGQAAAGRRPWQEASVGEKSGGARILDTRTMMTASQSAGALAGEGD